MSANAGYASKQDEVKQQERDPSTQNNGSNSQNNYNNSSRSINNTYGPQNQPGLSSYEPELNSGLMSNSMGTGYSSGYSGGYGNNYGSGCGSSYASGYGSTMSGGYGSSYGGSSYGGGYGSSYGGGYGGNSGYSSYGNNNQYSNRMSKPIAQQNGQNPEEMGPQQVPVAQDVWGLLNGMQAILQILYAGTGIVQFGKMFVKMSMKIMKLVCGKSLGLVFKLTGFNFLKNIIMKMASGKDWTSEFSAADLALEGEWGNSKSSNPNRSIFGKIVLATRLCSLLGAVFTLFLKSKMTSNASQSRPHHNITPELTASEHIAPQMDVPFEGVKSLYDEVKLIETEQENIEAQANEMVKAFEEEQSEDMDADLRKLDAFAEEAGIKLVQEEAKVDEAQNIEPEVQVISDIAEQNEEKIVAADAMNALEDVIQINEVADVPVIDNVEDSVVLIKDDKDKEEESIAFKSENEKPVEKTDTSSSIKPIESSTTSSKITADDFWKNKISTLEEETSKAVEKKEAKVEPEAESKPFELPSILQTIRDKPAAANKPWLMKKKKVVVEEKVETPAAVTTTTTTVQSVTPGEVQVVAENTTEVRMNELTTPGNNYNMATEELINSAAVDSTHITL